MKKLIYVFGIILGFAFAACTSTPTAQSDEAVENEVDEVEAVVEAVEEAIVDSLEVQVDEEDFVEEVEEVEEIEE